MLALPHRAGYLAAAVSDMLLQNLVLLTYRYNEAYAVNKDMKSLYDKRPKDMPLLLLQLTVGNGGNKTHMYIKVSLYQKEDGFLLRIY